MNPNAKEFVPAHILRKRQDEAALAKQLGDVDLDETKRADSAQGETSCKTQNNSAKPNCNSNDKAQDQTPPGSEDTNNQTSTNQNKEPHLSSTEEQCHKTQQDTFNNERSKYNHETNGEPSKDLDEDDRYLLKAGENYCEFNGEQFIIPGDDDEYDNEIPGSDNSHPGYDFGNAEDNEDEDVINAYDAFLSELP